MRYRFIALLILTSLLVAACGSPGTTPTPEPTPTQEVRNYRDCKNLVWTVGPLWAVNPNPCVEANDAPIGSQYSNVAVTRWNYTPDNRHQAHLINHDVFIQLGDAKTPCYINYKREDSNEPRGFRIEISWIDGRCGFEEYYTLQPGIRYVFKLAGIADIRENNPNNVTLSADLVLQDNVVIPLNAQGIPYQGYVSRLWVFEVSEPLDVFLRGTVSIINPSALGAFTLIEFALLEAPPDYGNDVVRILP